MQVEKLLLMMLNRRRMAAGYWRVLGFSPRRKPTARPLSNARWRATPDIALQFSPGHFLIPIRFQRTVITSKAAVPLNRLTLPATKVGGFLGHKVGYPTLANGPARPNESDTAALGYFSHSAF